MLQRDHARGLLVYAAELVGETLPESAINRVIDGYEDVVGRLPLAVAELLPQSPKARHTDPVTAKDAAQRSSARRRSQPRRLLNALAVGPPPQLTAEALARRTGMPLSSASTRLSELVRAGLAVEGAQAPTSNGAMALTYSLTPAGWAASREDGPLNLRAYPGERGAEHAA